MVWLFGRCGCRRCGQSIIGRGQGGNTWLSVWGLLQWNHRERGEGMLDTDALNIVATGVGGRLQRRAVRWRMVTLRAALGFGHSLDLSASPGLGRCCTFRSPESILQTRSLMRSASLVLGSLAPLLPIGPIGAQLATASVQPRMVMSSSVAPVMSFTSSNVALATASLRMSGAPGQQDRCFHVYLEKDTINTREYVARVLMMVCELSEAEATSIMREASTNWMACCGTWEGTIAQHVHDGMREAGLSVVITPVDDGRDLAE